MPIIQPLSKSAWIARYGGQSVTDTANDHESFLVEYDRICHGWKGSRMTPEQMDWVSRMRAELHEFHQAWYEQRRSVGPDFEAVDGKIRTAMQRVGLQMPDYPLAEDLDGEEHPPIPFLFRCLRALEHHFAVLPLTRS
jgi:hypothetical protein